MRQRSVVPLSFLAVALAGALAQAQTPCAGSVQTLELPAGLDGELRDSIYWDRDGAGPLPAELVIAGAFRRVGGVVVNGIARKDAVLGWQPLGSGVDGAVRCLAIDGANRLVLGGSFTYAGGVTAPRIARFDGAQYSALMSPPPALSGTVVALAPIGATAMNYIEQSGLGYFDGTAVYGVALGGVAPGIPGSAIDIARLPNGDLLVAGSFTSLAGQPASNIAVYRSGTNTVDPLQGGTNTAVRKVEALPNGDFYAFGPFSQVAGAAAAGVARFASNAWTTYPSTGVLYSVQGGGVDAAGQPVAFGSYGLSQYVNGAWQLLLVNGSALHVNGLAGGGLLVGNAVPSDTLVVPVGYLPRYGFTIQGGTASALADGLEARSSAWRSAPTAASSRTSVRIQASRPSSAGSPFQAASRAMPLAHGRHCRRARCRSPRRAPWAMSTPCCRRAAAASSPWATSRRSAERRSPTRRASTARRGNRSAAALPAPSTQPC